VRKLLNIHKEGGGGERGYQRSAPYGKRLQASRNITNSNLPLSNEKEERGLGEEKVQTTKYSRQSRVKVNQLLVSHFRPVGGEQIRRG